MLGLLWLFAILSGGCSGLRFATGPPTSGFRAAEMIDALGYGSIPPLDDPVHAAIARIRPDDVEPLAVIEAGGITRAYPLSILVWHEVVNDVVGGVPVVVAYSPLTDSVAAWVRRSAGRTFTFAQSGKIYAATGVMADRETGSLWLPPTGRAVAGPEARAKPAGALAPVAVMLVPASGYAEAFPDGTVLDPETGYARPYGRSPYQGYAARSIPPRRLFLRTPDPRLPAMSHVLAVPGGRVYPFDAVRDAGTINDEDVVVAWVSGVASAVDREVIADSRDAGSAVAFASEVDGRRLTFEPAEGPDGDQLFRDRQTGTRWNVFGRAVAGPLAGRALRPLAGIRSLWFGWAALDPDARVYAPGAGG
ncbi:MAG TPA: DUF3179 domain-containing (seleno)protein [Actinomycetota bacterium]